ncbi:DUF4839 domain-containing protein [Blastococcus sp. CCUG 61487]|uniref:DUF4839 domain-containing protein n=1 Tax=Blastococcus sp. CCUG 61487 TaxID=1840703 RepID=UPI00148551EF|nr:DUF4839 domain-containing protein [Blastococcus sp. CCUG 61487]
MVDDVQYEFTSVQAVRGTETKTIAKWQKDGWQIFSRNQGLLRTELTFRRVKPKTVGTRLLAAFRGLESRTQRALLAGASAMVLLLVAVGVIVGMQSGGSATESAASATEVEAVEPSSEPEEVSTPTSSAPTSSASAPTTPAPEATLTVENNADLAALVALRDPGAAEVGEFAAKYRGRTIEFDGNITALANHGSYTTRYDLLINTGDYSTTSSLGPSFKFEDVNITNDLHLTGPDIPDAIGVGDNLRIIARVVEYNSNSQLFLLKPVSTQVR